MANQPLRAPLPKVHLWRCPPPKSLQRPPVPASGPAGAYIAAVSATQILFVVVVAWMAIGFGGRLRDGPAWSPAARMEGFWSSIRTPRTLSCLEGVLSEKLGHGEVLETGVSGTGSQKVLVGTDGSPESQAALRTAIDLLGSRIGAIALAGVVPFEGELPGTSAARHLAEAGFGGSPPRADDYLDPRTGPRL